VVTGHGPSTNNRAGAMAFQITEVQKALKGSLTGSGS
jgi:hypothetical protein